MTPTDSGRDNRLSVRSGLAETAPADLVVLPVLFEGDLLGVIEFGSVNRFSELHIQFLDRLGAALGVSLNTILANRRTEELLRESQRLALEMQQQSDEMQRTNAELEEKAALLSEQNVNIESQNREIELARLGLEEKAQQLAAASQYKSEFLANMSHELRTPLNSLLLLARMLADNADANLTPKQIDFARTIHSAGSDLLALIDDILDLSKIEAGRMDIDPAEIPFDDIRAYVQQAFGPQAEEKGLAFTVVLGERLPAAMISDPQRLQQILRNLLANAVKFTGSGSVTLTIDAGRRHRSPDRRVQRHRHRHRHRRRQAGAGLRGVPAGRRHDQPAVRRHRPRPVDQPGTRPCARRRDHGRLQHGSGIHVHVHGADDLSRRTVAGPGTRRIALPPAGRRDRTVPARRRRSCVEPRASASTPVPAPSSPVSRS